MSTLNGEILTEWELEDVDEHAAITLDDIVQCSGLPEAFVVSLYRVLIGGQQSQRGGVASSIDIAVTRKRLTDCIGTLKIG